MIISKVNIVFILKIIKHISLITRHNINLTNSCFTQLPYLAFYQYFPFNSNQGFGFFIT